MPAAPDPEPTLDRIRQIAADVLAVDPAALSADSTPESIDSWDSVQHLNIILAIEQHFGFEFDPSELDDAKNLGAIAGAADRKLSA